MVSLENDPVQRLLARVLVMIFLRTYATGFRAGRHARFFQPSADKISAPHGNRHRRHMHMPLPILPEPITDLLIAHRHLAIPGTRARSRLSSLNPFLKLIQNRGVSHLAPFSSRKVGNPRRVKTTVRITTAAVIFRPGSV